MIHKLLEMSSQISLLIIQFTIFILVLAMSFRVTMCKVWMNLYG
jgi:hypothetical protein